METNHAKGIRLGMTDIHTYVLSSMTHFIYGLQNYIDKIDIKSFVLSPEGEIRRKIVAINN